MKDPENVHHLHRQWFTKADLAKKLGVSGRTINNLYNRGELARREVDGVVQWSTLKSVHPERHETSISSIKNHYKSKSSMDERLEVESSSCISMKLEEYEALQEKLNSCQIELARAEGTIRSQEHELAHLRALVDAYTRQREVSLWHEFKRFISRILNLQS